jgi:hypothetical protein
MAKRQNMIAGAVTCLPRVLLLLVLDYDSEGELLQKVCSNIRILQQIQTFSNIRTRPLYAPRPLYAMTPVKLRVNYINMIPTRTCKYCLIFPNFLVFINNAMVGLSWPANGCDTCNRYYGDLSITIGNEYCTDYYDNEYDPREEY